MADVARIIDTLRSRQVEFSKVDLMGQRGRTEFDYGVACGTFQAYETMLQDIENMLEEEKQSEKRRENGK
jgi:hypothetical protein